MAAERGKEEGGGIGGLETLQGDRGGGVEGERGGRVGRPPST